MPADNLADLKEKLANAIRIRDEQAALAALYGSAINVLEAIAEAEAGKRAAEPTKSVPPAHNARRRVRLVVSDRLQALLARAGERGLTMRHAAVAALIELGPGTAQDVVDRLRKNGSSIAAVAHPRAVDMARIAMIKQVARGGVERRGQLFKVAEADKNRLWTEIEAGLAPTDGYTEVRDRA